MLTSLNSIILNFTNTHQQIQNISCNNAKSEREKSTKKALFDKTKENKGKQRKSQKR